MRLLIAAASLRLAWGRCTFSERLEVSGSLAATSLWAGDLDGDGLEEEVVAGLGDDGFAVAEFRGGAVSDVTTVSDLAADAVAAMDGTIVVASQRDGLWLVDPSTESFNATRISPDPATAVTLVDADSDSDLDVVAVLNGTRVTQFLSPNFDTAELVTFGTVIGSSPSLLAAVRPDGSLATYTQKGVTVIADALLDVRAVRVVDDGSSSTVVTGSYLDDTVAFFANAEDPALVRATESAHGVVDVYAADFDGDGDLDALSACLDDFKIRKHSQRNLVFDTTVVDAEARGVRSLAAADLDGDAALDVVAAMDAGVFWYRNLDCAPPPEPSSSSSKKKSRRRFSLAVVIVFSVVASLAFFAAVTFFTMEGVQDKITKSIRRVTSRSLFAQEPAPDFDADPPVLSRDDAGEEKQDHPRQHKVRLEVDA
mmetsp:Transcript_1832/g.5463  ORF Transcript_1832/g.5463 Transcript_1832/m.5463 type:complete len:425 (-) Transcript_1832:207-1481(-)